MPTAEGTSVSGGEAVEPEYTLSFPPFHLDVVNARLWREGQRIPLRSKPLAVLRYLIEQQGRIVTKDELLQALWPGTVVSEAVLKVTIQAIRRALSDQAKTPRFIETGAGGYRWIAPLNPTPPMQNVKFKAQKAEGVLPSHPFTSSPLLVGREVELQRLHGWLGKALGGTRQVVFVTGEPGIGKTSVVETFVTGLETIGHFGTPLWITRGQCVEPYGAGEAYLPILEALERLCRQPSHERLLSLLRQHAPLWLAQMPSFLSPIERERLQREVLGSTQERMLREFVAALEALTSDTVLVLVLEDLHWSDYSTLDLLGRLARRREAAKLKSICTRGSPRIVSPSASRGCSINGQRAIPCSWST